MIRRSPYGRATPLSVVCPSCDGRRVPCSRCRGYRLVTLPEPLRSRGRKHCLQECCGRAFWSLESYARHFIRSHAGYLSD